VLCSPTYLKAISVYFLLRRIDEELYKASQLTFAPLPHSTPLPLSPCLDRRFSLILLLFSFPFCAHKTEDGSGMEDVDKKYLRITAV
jgi:hypothetical protein